MVTSIFALSTTLKSLLLTTISHAMVAKSLDCDYNIFTFVCALSLDVNVGHELNVEINVKLWYQVI
jgi:hypothetical protein